MKKFNMDKQALKEFLYGGLSEIVNNRNYYYKGIGPEYSHFTDRGEEAVKDFINVLSYKIIESTEADLDQRAKDMVMKGLKS